MRKVSKPIMTKSRSVMPLRIATPREPIKSATGRWWIEVIWWFSMWSTIQAELIRQCSMHKEKENESLISQSSPPKNKKSTTAPVQDNDTLSVRWILEQGCFQIRLIQVVLGDAEIAPCHIVVAVVIDLHDNHR